MITVSYRYLHKQIFFISFEFLKSSGDDITTFSYRGDGIIGNKRRASRKNNYEPMVFCILRVLNRERKG